MKRFLAVFLMLAIVLTSLSLTAMAADADGWKKGAEGWQYIQGGKPVADKWIQEGKDWYYIKPDTYMAADSFTATFDQYGEPTAFYYLQASGKMLAGAWQKIITVWEDEDGETHNDVDWIYADTNGRLAWDQWMLISGKWFYFDSIWMLHDGVFEIDGKYYYFKESGDMAVGWNEIFGIKGIWVYSDASGVLANKWKKIGDKWYWFGDYSDWGIASLNTIECFEKADGSYDYYAFDKSGAMVTNGWYAFVWEEEAAPEWYYLGADGKAIKGWVTAGGKWYYMDPDYASMWVGPAVIKGVEYRFDYKSGAMITGWFKEDGDWYYYKDSGAMAKNEWMQINGKWYFFDEDGRMLANGTYVISDSKQYTFDANGVWVK